MLPYPGTSARDLELRRAVLRPDSSRSPGVSFGSAITVACSHAPQRMSIRDIVQVHPSQERQLTGGGAMALSSLGSRPILWVVAEEMLPLREDIVGMAP